MKKIEIESGIPLSEGLRPVRGQYLYPFDDMKVGDSFLVVAKTPNSLRTSVRKFTSAHPEMDFEVRTMTYPDEEGNRRYRCWRTQ